MLTFQTAGVAATEVTAIQLNPTNNGISIRLNLQGESQESPQVSMGAQGNRWIADITNVQLRLPGDGGFRQANPAPGVASVALTPLTATSVRLVVTGEGGSLTGKPDPTQ
ncbi:AMIN domain-containing protein [Neosynechococcus sphagnicola]|uniref:AMIN domain-containing protein n=1 Tax=Neosynechococcus sphagnicola TaxID=1501145 RepID=UPI00068F5277|nr:AMIN domain-containing protein [Neosynechococcus sphagnicola]